MFDQNTYNKALNFTFPYPAWIETAPQPTERDFSKTSICNSKEPYPFCEESKIYNSVSFFRYFNITFEIVKRPY